MTQNSLSIQMDTDQTLIAQEESSQRVLEIRIQAPNSAAHGKRLSLNLALVLDRSGSMSGEKLDFVKQAAAHVLDLLQDQDTLALVAYDDEITLLSPSTRVSRENRIDLQRQISRLRPGGTTFLSGGWLAGCHEVAAAAQNGTLNRTLLLTDGLANVGETDLEILAHQARELFRRGVSTTTFGVGEGFNEHLLEAMSNQGGGNFYYIETPGDIPELFLREFKELAAVTARDVEISLEFPPQVIPQVLGGWVTEYSGGRLHISLGNLYSGHDQDIYIRLAMPPAGAGGEPVVKAWVLGKADAGQLYEAEAEVNFQYADKDSAEAAPRNRDLLERYAVVELADTATEALKLERQGMNAEANQLLDRSINMNRPYLNPGVAGDYQKLSERMKQGMVESDRKQTHYSSYNQKRKREQ
ncbi:MAG TPA: VWA domain-containing protein [Anaerolineales bacterium]|nr:VWA domain-containing protein [Anaerolineales bacterium]